jgi:hypothetical protein
MKYFKQTLSAAKIEFINKIYDISKRLKDPELSLFAEQAWKDLQ